MARNSGARRWFFGVMVLSLASIIVLARPASTQSDTGTPPWIAPTAVATGLTDADWPSLAFTRDGVEHAVWQTDGQIYYTAQMPGQGWNPPPQDRQWYVPGIGDRRPRPSSRPVRQPVHGQLRNLRYRFGEWHLVLTDQYFAHIGLLRVPRGGCGHWRRLICGLDGQLTRLLDDLCGAVERHLLEQSADCQRARARARL